MIKSLSKTKTLGSGFIWRDPTNQTLSPIHSSESNPQSLSFSGEGAVIKMGAENVGNRRPHSEDSGVVLTGTANAKEGNGGLVDIGESKDAYLVRVALAGLQTNRGNVKCVIQRDGKVHIQGVMNGVELLKNSSTVYHMRAQQLSSPGPFTLSFRLPGPVDPRLFSPHFQHDGILEIVVLKSSKLSKK